VTMMILRFCIQHPGTGASAGRMEDWNTRLQHLLMGADEPRGI